MPTSVGSTTGHSARMDVPSTIPRSVSFNRRKKPWSLAPEIWSLREIWRTKRRRSPPSSPDAELLDVHSRFRSSEALGNFSVERRDLHSHAQMSTSCDCPKTEAQYMVFTVLTNHRFRLILVGLSRTGVRRELPSTSQGRRGFFPVIWPARTRIHSTSRSLSGQRAIDIRGRAPESKLEGT